MKPTCGISSSQVFFSVAAVTGCISVIFNMTSIDPVLDSSGGITPRRAFKFGPTYVVEPKGKHQATIVWLHGLGDDGLSWSQILETLPLPNIKWICPTSPVQPLTFLGGLSTTAFKLGVGGFSMGAATAIYSASCFARGKLGNGTRYSAHLAAVVGLSGWLPCANHPSNEVEGPAASLPILLCHGRGDEVVWFRYGEKSAEKLTSAGFENLTFKSFHSYACDFSFNFNHFQLPLSKNLKNRLGHYIIPEEMDEVSSWLTSKLELEGPQPKIV